MEKNPHDVCTYSMYDWKIPSYTYEEKEKIAAAQRIIQFSLFWGRHIGLVLHTG